MEYNINKVFLGSGWFHDTRTLVGILSRVSACPEDRPNGNAAGSRYGASLSLLRSSCPVSIKIAYTQSLFMTHQLLLRPNLPLRLNGCCLTFSFNIVLVESTSTGALASGLSQRQCLDFML
jgi:hypothetical protein